MNWCAGRPGRTCDSPASDAAESLHASKKCIIRVGDTVFAKSGVATCAGMAIGLVEDLWSGCADEVTKLGIPVAAPRIRLRWMLTIGNIAISRARLPRGSQASYFCVWLACGTQQHARGYSTASCVARRLISCAPLLLHSGTNG